jgi:16S rRNA (guanine527-N7)-methyltransferase
VSATPLTDLPPSLIEALRQARDCGFLGDGPIDTHIAHALGFAAAAESVGDGVGAPLGGSALDGRQIDLWMDLGSGGGIPGLILAHRWPDRPAVLLDSNVRRTRFLAQVVEDQGWDDRIRVVTSRAEVAGRAEDLRGAFSLVVARSFGSPSVTAECAAPFLRCGGILVVSEPPTSGAVADLDRGRWPAEGLMTVGLTRLALWRGQFGYGILRQAQECPPRFPRRVGVPAKRPLYRTPDEA